MPPKARVTSKKKGPFIMTGVAKKKPESKTKKPEIMEQIVLLRKWKLIIMKPEKALATYCYNILSMS